ncbi:MAG: hypothetical protein ACODAB_01505 [Gemmatimonadota bacterium]
MIRRPSGIFAALALLLAAAPLSGQDLDTACEAIAGSAVGAWTEHRLASPNGEMNVRFALVSDRGATWYEVRSQTHAGASILQLRVPGFPFTPAEIEEVVMKTGATPAMRVPDAMVEEYRASEQAGPLADIRAECRKAEVVGREEVTVAAGTFQTTHLRFPASDGDVWVSDQVPFGIVRGDIPGQGTTELTSHGTGAVSAITETPVSLGETGSARPDSGP